jgi:hypothetical protein
VRQETRRVVGRSPPAPNAFGVGKLSELRQRAKVKTEKSCQVVRPEGFRDCCHSYRGYPVVLVQNTTTKKTRTTTTTIISSFQSTFKTIHPENLIIL